MIDEITISRGSLVLADGDPWGAGVCEELRVNGTAVLDIAFLIGAPTPSIFDRVGRKNQISFRIFREARSPLGALDRALRGPLLLAGKADLSITLQIGGTAATWTAAGAGWSPIEAAEFNGWSSVISCELTCGPLTTAGFTTDHRLLLLNEDGTTLLNEDDTPIINE